MCTIREYTYYYLVNVKYFAKVMTYDELINIFMEDLHELNQFISKSLSVRDNEYKRLNNEELNQIIIKAKTGNICREILNLNS